MKVFRLQDSDGNGIHASNQQYWRGARAQTRVRPDKLDATAERNRPTPFDDEELFHPAMSKGLIPYEEFGQYPLSSRFGFASPLHLISWIREPEMAIELAILGVKVVVYEVPFEHMAMSRYQAVFNHEFADVVAEHCLIDFWCAFD